MTGLGVGGRQRPTWATRRDRPADWSDCVSGSVVAERGSERACGGRQVANDPAAFVCASATYQGKDGGRLAAGQLVPGRPGKRQGLCPSPTPLGVCAVAVRWDGTGGRRWCPAFHGLRPCAFCSSAYRVLASVHVSRSKNQSTAFFGGCGAGLGVRRHLFCMVC